MKNAIIAVAGLSAVLAGCAAGGLKYKPIEPAVPLVPNRLMKIWSIEFKDTSGGVTEIGAEVPLPRPFFDIFREGLEKRLRSLRVKSGYAGGTFVGIDLTKVDVRSSDVGVSEVTATISYSVIVYGGLDAVCRQEATAFAVSREGLAEKPAADALEKALAKAVDRLGPVISESCLYNPLPSAPKTAELRVRDPERQQRDIAPSARSAEPSQWTP